MICGKRNVSPKVPDTSAFALPDKISGKGGRGGLPPPLATVLVIAVGPLSQKYVKEAGDDDSGVDVELTAANVAKIGR